MTKKYLGYDLEDETQKMELAHKISDKLKEGQTLEQAIGCRKATLANIYALAYAKYQQGHYQDAIDLFQYLLILNHERYEYALGLAAAFQALGNFEGAASTYLYCAVLEPSDPVPFFHGAECMRQIGRDDLARDGWRNAISAAQEREEYAELVRRSKQNLESFKE